MCAQTFAAFQRFSGLEQTHALSRVPTTRLQSSAVALLRDRICSDIVQRGRCLTRRQSVSHVLSMLEQVSRATRFALVVETSLGSRATGMCTGRRFHNDERRPVPCRLGCVNQPDDLRPYNACLLCFHKQCVIWRHAGALVRPTAILHDLFVNLSQHRMLAAGMIDAFVCAFNVHRAHTEQPGRFSHRTIGRVRMMTMLCCRLFAWVSNPLLWDPLPRCRIFFLSRPKTRCRHSPTVRSTTASCWP